MNDTHHVIIGAGPIGAAIAREATRRNERVRLVSRSGTRPEGLASTVEIAKADVLDAAQLRDATRGATHLYNATNARDYHLWAEQFPPLQNAVLAAARDANAVLVAVENLYGYAPGQAMPLTEQSAMAGRGSRSTTRIAMTEQLEDAHRRGEVKVVRVRASDLIGPGVVQSMVGETFFRPLLTGRRVHVMGDLDVPHSLTSVDDFGRALVTLGSEPRALGRVFHAPNAAPVTVRELIQMVTKAAGLTEAPKTFALPRALVPVIGWFVTQLQGISENTHMFYEPFIASSAAYEQLTGDRATPLETTVAATVTWYRAANLATEKPSKSVLRA